MVDALYPAQREYESTENKLEEIPSPESNLHRGSTVAASQIDIGWSDEIEAKNEIMEAVYIQACYCSLGATLEVESRPSFDEYMKKVSGLMMVEDTVEKPATARTDLSIFSLKYI